MILLYQYSVWSIPVLTCVARIRLWLGLPSYSRAGPWVDLSHLHHSTSCSSSETSLIFRYHTRFISRCPRGHSGNDKYISGDSFPTVVCFYLFFSGGEMLRVRVPLLPPCGSDMAYGVVRQGFDPGLQVVLCQQ
jgi:hypothetical protein